MRRPPRRPMATTHESLRIQAVRWVNAHGDALLLAFALAAYAVILVGVATAQ